MNPHNQMRDADASALQEGTLPPGSTVLPCQQDTREAVEVLVVDEAEQPLCDVAVQLEKSEHAVIPLRTGSQGIVRFESLVPGSYQFTLPLADQEAWEVLGSIPLAEPLSSGDADWTEPPESGQTSEYVVALGDCLSSIAFRSGFLPDTLWNYGPNAALKEGLRRVHTVNPGDVVRLPKLGQRRETAATGNRYKVKRRGLPERLRFRFLDFRMQPRAGLQYLLKIETESGSMLPAVQGALRGDGSLDEPIPPDAVRGHLLLRNEQGEPEEVVIDLGYVNALDEVSGVQARLNNLHYNAGPENGELNEQTRHALRRFQADYKLPDTGKADGPTREKLLELHRS